MSYLACTNCDWQQDHFWDETSNPIRDLLALEKELLQENLDELTASAQEKPALPRRVAIAVTMQQASSRVLTMQWKTQQHWEDAGRPDCPLCGADLHVR